MRDIFFVAKNAADQSLYESGLVLVVVTWFIAVFVLAANGAYVVAEGGRPVVMLLGLLIPLGGFLLAYTALGGFRRFILSLDIRPLILLHAWRTLGLGFIALYYHDVLPALFAFPAGLGDAAAAIWATFLVAALYAVGKGVGKIWVWRWNVFGFLDLVIAVSLGMTVGGGPAALEAGPMAASAMVQFPLVLIPGFFVPFFLITHVIVFFHLRHWWRDEAVIRLERA